MSCSFSTREYDKKNARNTSVIPELWKNRRQYFNFDRLNVRNNRVIILPVIILLIDRRVITKYYSIIEREGGGKRERGRERKKEREREEGKTHYQRSIFVQQCLIIQRPRKKRKEAQYMLIQRRTQLYATMNRFFWDEWLLNILVLLRKKKYVTNIRYFVQ